MRKNSPTTEGFMPFALRPQRGPATLSDMTWTQPEHSKTRVKNAGKLLRKRNGSPEDIAEAQRIVDNWRSSHGYPLNAIATNLRNWSKSIDGEVTIAQRRKRMPSIIKKLERKPDLSVAAMQDLGGCRIIVPTMEDVSRIERSVRRSRHKHELVNDRDDYIQHPRLTGYRSRHLVFRYQSEGPGAPWRGLNIEMQIRTQLQHAWATAVETVGTFTGQDLKSGRGDADWLRFFALASSQFAAVEGTPSVPGTSNISHERLDELYRLTEELNVHDRLRSFSFSMQAQEEDRPEKTNFSILQIDLSKRTLSIEYFEEDPEAQSVYADIESSIDTNIDAVLVSLDKTDSLKAAYPNYFADTDLFLRSLLASFA